MNNILLQINRKGKFTIEPSQCSNIQCGREGEREFSYEVSIEATEKCLREPEMFVLDNTIFKDYFDNKYMRDKDQCRSCEIVACDAIKYFRNLMLEENAPFGHVDIKKIVVIISGSEFSHIKGEWTNDL